MYIDQNYIYTFFKKNQLIISCFDIFEFHESKNLLLPTSFDFDEVHIFFVLLLLGFHLSPGPSSAIENCAHQSLKRKQKSRNFKKRLLH